MPMALTYQDGILHTLALIAAGVYVIVGIVQARRRSPPEARGAQRGFVLWWFGLAAISILGVVFALGFQAAEYGLGMVRVVIYLIFGLLYLMLGGLVYYLMYLYTGDRRWRIPILAFYLLQVALLAFLFESQGPYITLGEGGEAEVAYLDRYASAHPLMLFFSLSIAIPPLAGGIAYFLLFFHVEDRTTRYRILLVSIGIVLWFGYSTLSTLTRALIGIEEQGFAARLIGQLFGLLAATLVLAAYLPPRVIQQRFGVQSVLDDDAGRPT